MPGCDLCDTMDALFNFVALVAAVFAFCITVWSKHDAYLAKRGKR